jgi:Domain of unknown function (DUF4396)
MIPSWLHSLSIAFLILGFLFAAVIVADEFSHPQHMWIMNVVWPVVALFGSVEAVWNYFTYERLGTRKAAAAAKRMGHDRPNKTQIPFPVIVGKGAAHCGSGCTLGDICAEWLAFVVPAIAVGLGWQSIFPDKIFAVWVLDCLFAHAYGIVFQYFTIAPMRGLGFAAGIGSHKGRYVVSDCMADRYVWLYGVGLFLVLPRPHRDEAQGQFRRVLVHDADRDVLRVSDKLPRKLVAHQFRRERKDVARPSWRPIAPSESIAIRLPAVAGPSQ